MTRRKSSTKRLLQAVEEDPLMTRAEVAALFRVRDKTVTGWVNEGRLSGLQLPGGHWRFRRSVVMRAVHDWRMDDNAAPK